MLVLSRKVNESIIIDDRIVITIVGIQGNKVKVEIQAPQEISVQRQEVWMRTQQEKQNGSPDTNLQNPGDMDTNKLGDCDPRW